MRPSTTEKSSSRHFVWGIKRQIGLWSDDESTGETATEPRVTPEQRAVRAKLRRGLRRKPGASPEIYPYVVPLLAEQSDDDWRFFLIASLIAWHPRAATSGTFGTAFAALARESKNHASLERRFGNLLASHPDQIADHLRHAVALLRDGNVPVCWEQLINDLADWSDPDRRVQLRWARDFWPKLARAGADDMSSSGEAEGAEPDNASDTTSQTVEGE